MDEKSQSVNVVYVPPQPGPLVSVQMPGRRTDEIDHVLDDVFGEEDHQGPTATDAMLVAAGSGAVAVGQLADLPVAITAVGVGLIGLGAILPIRSGLRRVSDRRQRSRIAATIGDGKPLRQDHPTLTQMAALHDQVLQRSERLVPDVQMRVASAAHALVEEVATLLRGELPVGAAEVEYVDARAHALEELATAVEDPRVGDGDAVRRRAMTEARIEIEQVAGSSALTDSADLRDELLPDHDA